MTWGEFKKRVEACGVTDGDEISHIDWSGYHGEQVGACRLEDGQIFIDDGAYGQLPPKPSDADVRAHAKRMMAKHLDSLSRLK